MAGFTSILSGGLIDTSAPNYANVAQRNEKARQALINLGTQQINSVFGGGTAPFYAPANPNTSQFDPHQSYYKIGPKGPALYWAPGGKHPPGQFSQSGVGQAIGSGGGDLGAAFGAKALGLDKLFGKEQSPKQVAKTKFRRGQLFMAPEYQTFEGFGDPFYQGREQDYIRYALPQLAEQYRQNRNAIKFGLANKGLLGSTVEASANAGLERTAGEGRQTIADTARAGSNSLRQQIEGARQAALSQLYQSANPGQAIQSAVQTASGFQAPSTFAPIGNLFTSLAQQYVTNQLLNNYRQGASAFDTTNPAKFIAPV